MCLSSSSNFSTAAAATIITLSSFCFFKLFMWWGTGKFRLSVLWLFHNELHWLDVPEHVDYKLSITMFRCVYHKDKAKVPGRQTSFSSSPWRHSLTASVFHQYCCHLLVTSYYSSSMYGRLVFCVAGTTIWTLWWTICVACWLFLTVLSTN